MNPDLGWAHQSHTEDDRITVTLSGEIDMAGAGQLHQLLQDAVQSASTVDVAAVGFIGALVTANTTTTTTAAATGQAFTVVNASAQVRRILDTLTD